MRGRRPGWRRRRRKKRSKVLAEDMIAGMHNAKIIIKLF